MEIENFDEWVKVRGYEPVTEAGWLRDKLQNPVQFRSPLKKPPAPAPAPPPPVTRTSILSDTEKMKEVDGYATSFAHDLGILHNGAVNPDMVPTSFDPANPQPVSPKAVAKVVDAIKRFTVSAMLGGKDNQIGMADTEVILRFLYGHKDKTTGETLARSSGVRTPAALLNAYSSGHRPTASHVTSHSLWQNMQGHYQTMADDEDIAYRQSQKSQPTQPSAPPAPAPSGTGPKPGTPPGGPPSPTTDQAQAQASIDNLIAYMKIANLNTGAQNQALGLLQSVAKTLGLSVPAPKPPRSPRRKTGGNP